MVALFFIIAGSLALLLVAPPFLFVYLSLEPHLARRRLRASESSKPASVTTMSVRTERSTLRPAA